MTRDTLLSRRSLLAGVGVVGLFGAGVGLGSAQFGSTPPFTQYTYAEPNGETVLRVAWYETYNGRFVERSTDSLSLTDETSWSDAAVAGEYDDLTGASVVESGPVISLENVLPGDSGTLTVGLLVQDPVEADVRLWLRGRYTSEENVRYEPELPADETDDAGELDEAIQLSLWYDGGIPGVGCNGSHDLGETAVVPGGSFGDIFDALADGVQLNLSPFALGDGCLRSGVQQCLGFRWHLPKHVGNVVQSDSLSFDLEFRTTRCDDLDIGGAALNPFESDGGAA